MEWKRQNLIRKFNTEAQRYRV